MADVGGLKEQALENGSKKPFNKKKWREEKYSTKFKVQKWQDKRKMILTKTLNRQLRKDGVEVKPNRLLSDKKSTSKIKEAQMQYEQKKKQQRNAATEAKNIKEEKLKKIREHRSKKLERLKILNQKTRKGQPLMKGRLELLQQKIEKMVAENKL